MLNNTKANREPSRTRTRGTRVTKPLTGEERIAAVRQIVAEGQYAKVDGVMVDHFSASAIVTVYDALKPEHQVNYRNRPVSQMASMAFKLLKK